MTMANYKYWDINIDKGGDFTCTFTVYDDGNTPVNLTGATVTATLREYPAGVTTKNFTCTHNGNGGQITFTMPHEMTATIGYSYGWYDVKVQFPNNTIEEVLHGKAFISVSVTRFINPGTIAQIVAYGDFDDFPTQGNTDRIYFDETHHMLYWWNGSQYISLTYEMQGLAATIRIGTVTTLPAGSNATVTNTGSATNAYINFGIPRGATGEAATIQIGTVTTVSSGEPALVLNSGTANDAILDFQIPQGATGFLGYATFEVDLETGDLMMYYNIDEMGADFQIDENGDLIVMV